MRNSKFWIIIISLLLCFPVLSLAGYGHDSFYDEETITVQGNRPKVDIEVTELTVTITPDDFVDGVAEKIVGIANEGNVPSRIDIEVADIPVDLEVTAVVGNEFLLKGQTTDLTITVQLSEQQVETSFEFTVLVKAHLRP
jgi:hypothetical protein